jgi:hypothetical protein
MESLASEPHCVMSQVLPTSRDAEYRAPLSMSTEEKKDLNPGTAPPLATNASINASDVLEDTNTESSRSATCVVLGRTQPPPNNTSGAGEEGHVHDSGSGDIDVDVDENENEDETGSSEVSDGDDLKVSMNLCLFRYNTC